MKVLITGTSRGIGRETALKFLKMGHMVYGMDVMDSTISDDGYFHFKKSIMDEDLPDLDVDILVNNAAVQNADDIDVNLKVLTLLLILMVNIVMFLYPIK